MGLPEAVVVGPGVQLEEGPIAGAELQPDRRSEIARSRVRPRDGEQQQFGPGLAEGARQLQAELGDVPEDFADDAGMVVVVDDDQLPGSDLVAGPGHPFLDPVESALHALESRREGVCLRVLIHLTSFRSAVLCGAADVVSDPCLHDPVPEVLALTATAPL
jgi:hypothetical protein